MGSEAASEPRTRRRGPVLLLGAVAITSLVGAGALRAWQAKRRPLVVHTTAKPLSVAWHPSGEILATGEEDASFELWSAQGERLQTISTPDTLGGNRRLMGIAFSPAGDRLVTAWLDGGCYVTAVRRGGDGVLACTGDVARVGSLGSSQYTEAYSPSGDGFAITDDSGVVIREPTAGAPDRLVRHSKRTLALAYSPAGDWLATGAGDGGVRLFETRGWGGRELGFHAPEVNSVAFSSDGRLLASGCDHGIVKLWSLPGGELVHEANVGFRVCSVALSTAGDLLVAAGDAGARAWTTADGKPHDLPLGPEPFAGWCRAAFSPSDDTLALTNEGSSHLILIPARALGR